MKQEADYGIRDKSDTAHSLGEGDWSYLREHLDHPGFLSMPLGMHLSPQSLGSLGAKLSAWLMQRWRNPETPRARLVALGRLPVGPRQAVLLIEADGTRVLVGTSIDGALSFLPLPVAGTIQPQAGTTQDASGSTNTRWIEAAHRNLSPDPIATLRTAASSNWDGTLTQNRMPELTEDRNLKFAHNPIQHPLQYPVHNPVLEMGELLHAQKSQQGARQRSNKAKARRINLSGRVSW